MKIWGDIPKIDGIYNKQGGVKRLDKTSAVSSKKDVVSISGQARDYQAVTKALKGVPDVRRDLVDPLAEKVQTGKYDIKGKNIVDKLLDSILDKRV